MTHLLTTIRPCLLLTMAVVTPSTTEAINFKAPTAPQGGNLNAVRPHPSLSALASYSRVSYAANGSPARSAQQAHT